MLFNSFGFIFLFLPLTLLGYFYLARSKTFFLAKVWLFLSSLFFYGFWNPNYLILILFSMLVNYLIGIKLGSGKSNFLLTLGIGLNLSLLFFYKYVDFFIHNLNLFPGIHVESLGWALPLGISFFTFQQIAYLVDSARGLTKEYHPINYGVFVSFFPQLIAGPIVHHKEVMPQFNYEELARPIDENLSRGLFIFLMGLGKKVILADTFALVANAGYQSTSSLSSIEAWATSIAYSLQLYYDFSGYSAMAIGLGLMFNIRLPDNFNSPYQSTNIQEFWRRWHITLSRFLRDYVYIPLGGNRKGEVNTYANLLITFVLGGIWHGAGWNFLIWGALHGLALVIYRIWQKNTLRIPAFIGVIITLFFVNLTWVFFRAPDWDTAFNMVYNMFSNQKGDMAFSLIPNLYDMPIWLIGILLLFYKNSMQWGNSFRPTFNYAIIIALLFIINMIYLNAGVSKEFLYFDF